ncbi:FAD-dependent oxidoreductase, partial [Streptomyces sp. NPDC049577]|uniref:FAD-dependent oxidoreductase n=1 Tax=Streptomyces sp. NPDC049577 TaxID=3155153 RepID=UPI003424405C
MKYFRDVVVIGAGPTGLALAIALRRYGVDTLIVDKEPSTKQEARACVVWQRALEALRDLGCADAFMKQGLPVGRAEFRVAVFHYWLGWFGADYTNFADDPAGWFSNLVLP